MAELVLLSEKNRERYLKLISPVGDLLARLGVHPNVLSAAGLVLSVLAALLYGQGTFLAAACVVILAGICDTLDGLIARQAKKESPFGAFFDSTLDRYSDMFLFIGLAYFFAGGRPPLPGIVGGVSAPQDSPLTVVLVMLTIGGSYLVSYTRARAEGLGVECKGGLMQRPERITLLILGSLCASLPAVGLLLMKLALLILAVSTNLTALYRIYYVRHQILGDGRTTHDRH